MISAAVIKTLPIPSVFPKIDTPTRRKIASFAALPPILTVT